MITGDDDEPLDYGQNPPNRVVDEYFSYIDCVDSVPPEWITWIDGESNYKPFSMQYLECRHNGNLFLESCHCCGEKLIMCKKYGGQCISSRCRADRLKEKPDGVSS
jgi:hypothetical protein